MKHSSKIDSHVSVRNTNDPIVTIPFDGFYTKGSLAEIKQFAKDVYGPCYIYVSQESNENFFGSIIDIK